MCFLICLGVRDFLFGFLGLGYLNFDVVSGVCDLGFDFGVFVFAGIEFANLISDFDVWEGLYDLGLCYVCVLCSLIC